ncbi:protein of unknown function [Evansella caseinilytica]|uniref:Uncharacterized protein n=1 Tax=Evansella caseinilytica TaxID=1503961 RepID=A0A1H3RGY2_9BACI|nr:DUF5082 family protein [Evansella caseinilytica]SDZ24947.1 protein of unknown function [Evansella caseinilytica]
MNSRNLSHLLTKKSAVMQDIRYSRSQLSQLADKITRLRTAVNRIQTDIIDLETTKRKIDRFSVDTSSWKGANETAFVRRYSTYRSNVNHFLQKTVATRDELEADLRSAEQSNLYYTNSLSGLQASLSSLDNQIRQAQVQKE